MVTSGRISTDNAPSDSSKNVPMTPAIGATGRIQTEVKTAARSVLRRWTAWLHPEEVLAIVMMLATLTVNIAVHHTLNTHILSENVDTYRALFRGQKFYFLTALRYCVSLSAAWYFLRFLAGFPPDLAVLRQRVTLGVALRALPIYFFCAVAFGNLQGFIHRLSPTDRDRELATMDRVLFLGHDPLKLLEPLVTGPRVHFFVQVYISMLFLPFTVMVIFLLQGKLPAFRDTIVSLVLSLVIGYPGYLIMPAIGPQYVLRHEYVRPIFDVAGMLRYGTDHLTRDCFPSLHTGVSIVALILMWRYGANWLYRIVFAVWCLAIVFSTMYLRIHYVTDVVAGVVLAVVATYLGPRLNSWWYAGTAYVATETS